MEKKLTKRKISDPEMLCLIHTGMVAVKINKPLVVGKCYNVISDSDKVGIIIKVSQDCPHVLKVTNFN